MAKTLVEIEAQFKEPFPVECIDLLPKASFEKDGKTMCMALPYADKRVYEDRLNALVPGEWSTPPPVVIATAQKIIVYVTVIVCGISHTDVGEANLFDGNGKPSENAATESQAQGFKRACSQFGLGRYLYDLEKVWVPYNKQRKQIDLDGAGIAHTVSGMYKKAGLRLNDEDGKAPQPKRVVNDRPNLDDAIKQRLNNCYDDAKELALFKLGKTNQENAVALFMLFSEITGTKIASPSDLTEECFKAIETHIGIEKEKRLGVPA